MHVGDGLQMVSISPPEPDVDLPTTDAVSGRAVELRALTDADVPAMLALIDLTKPGPFRPRTIELGGYTGIFHDDELVAMAGQRMRPPGYTEISAVCAPTRAPGGMYASILTAHCGQRHLGARRDPVPPPRQCERCGAGDLREDRLRGPHSRRLRHLSLHRLTQESSVIGPVGWTSTQGADRSGDAGQATTLMASRGQRSIIGL